jgi:hypothetical protein
MRNRLLLVLMLGLCCLGMGRKKPVLSVRFYTQTQGVDSTSFAVPVTLLNGQRSYVDQLEAISEHDIVAVYPFTSANGTLGCAFRLNDHGTIGLDTLSVAKRGSLLIATINSRQVADILIDQRVPDGIVTIPGWITKDEMKEITDAFPVMGGKRQ